MRIQHNIMAMNSYRNYNNNTSSVSRNLEKLSSGYKINRAGDDAAGLAISEKMRAQISGLSKAQDNVKDGISLVKTAEGALQEVQDMMNRMYKLAVQSANGTFDNAVDRANLQKEVDALKTEINRIADSSNFNGIKLLDGSLDASSAKISGSVGGNPLTLTDVPASPSSTTTGAITQSGTVGGATATAKITYTDANGVETTKTFSFQTGKDAASTAANMIAVLKSDTNFSNMFTVDGDEGGITFESKDGFQRATVTEMEVVSESTDQLKIEKTKPADVTQGKDAYQTFDLSGLTDGDKITIGDSTYTYVANATGEDGKTFGSVGALAAAAAKNGTTLNVDNDAAVYVVEGGGKGLKLQIGDTSESFNQMMVSVGDMHTGALGIAGVDIGNQDGAAAAVDLLKNAINKVSMTRGTLGATQNRLEHTQNNLSVMEENIQDAESTIRDTDVAKEMMAYTKNNILVQSAQAMLAQANQIPQGVLQLLG